MTPPQRQQLLVVDDHDAVLQGTVSALKQDYPEADIRTVRTAAEAIASLTTVLPALLVMDLSVPQRTGEPSQVETGISLLRSLMQQYPDLNIVVQSAHVKSLVRLKPAIDSHRGGFTIVDKSLPLKEMLIKVDWAMQGLIYTPRDMRTGLEVKPEWLQVLQLAFIEGLQDKAIAEQMNVSERTVRHYWTKVQDALDVYPDAGKNIRIQTEIRAREEGLID
ncbi:response regulator transcription factor [Nodosilinea sp. P-1105]|uniref:response regulator transcription factor n=1 Tax=Nodosilinea sp. P-1105 TaxID=2546229 RepID=UPI00146CB302|nr:response regulator transcription factor [Nodosilinea sp. P-1105]NMF84984.1 response regulator transcription factor [Nodosilinea sp. P-1105]